MNVKVVVAVVVIALAYLVWHAHSARVEAEALQALSDENGFLDLASPTGADPRKVWIVAAANCPKEGAQRAEALAHDLAERNVAFERHASISFAADAGDPALFRRLDTVLNGETPIVFVNGRIKSNPALDEVLAEYEIAQR
jgi:hypothetical protein